MRHRNLDKKIKIQSFSRGRYNKLFNIWFLLWHFPSNSKVPSGHLHCPLNKGLNSLQEVHSLSVGPEQVLHLVWQSKD